MSENHPASPTERLCLRPGAQVLRISSDQIQVALTNHNATFSGASVVQPLNRILEMIETGEASQNIVSKVSSETGNSEGFVRYLLNMLEQHGCTFRIDETQSTAGLDQSHSFEAALDSHLAQTGMNPANGRAILADYKFLLLAPDHLSEVAEHDLKVSGLHSALLKFFSEGEDTDLVLEQIERHIKNGSPKLIACFGLSYRSSLVRLINELCVEQQVPVFFAVIDGLIGRLGPYIVPGDTACLECALERILSNTTQEDVNALLAHRARSKGRVSLPPFAHPLFEQAIFNLYLMELSQIALGRFTRTLGGLLEHTTLSGLSSHSSLLRTPRCPICSPATPQRMAWDARFSAPKVKSVDT